MASPDGKGYSSVVTLVSFSYMINLLNNKLSVPIRMLKEPDNDTFVKIRTCISNSPTIKFIFLGYFFGIKLFFLTQVTYFQLEGLSGSGVFSFLLFSCVLLRV